MRGIRQVSPFACARYLRARSTAVSTEPHSAVRYASKSAQSRQTNANDESVESGQEEEKDVGAMSRRLSEMSDESIETGARSAAKAVKEAGFSEDLRRRLEDKIADANFRNEHPSAFAQADMPPSAGKGTRDIAAAEPWTGTESVQDAALRMLTDAHKPIRAPRKIPGVAGPPSKVDTGRPSKKQRTGVAAGSRIANARDKTSAYESMKGLTEQEREKFRQEMKQRFQPGARAVPATVHGLASLANERIEDAIASGKFKNLPRGQKIERDYNASSPFIDTTEYLMNKMIQRQDIVPPWIEKQQELVTNATRFRSRLRADWRRHVARVISSKGGALETQMRLADEYALAESIENPPKKKEEKLNAVDDSGHLSQITLSGELKASPSAESTSIQEEEAKVENEIKIMEQTFNDDGTIRSRPDETVTITTEQPKLSPVDTPASIPPHRPTVPPFRDPQWEQTERAYHEAAINSLNSLARSYNLMAPSIARKPYYYLNREMKACFADVAPQVAGFIQERALAPKVKGIELIGHKPGGMLEKLGTGQAAQVYDEQKPQYGFKEFWRDLFAASKA